MNARLNDHNLGRSLPGVFRLIAIPVLLAAIGCQQYDWRDDFQRAETQAREENKHLFIFYKSYLDQDSNRMLGGEVLSDPEVVAMLQDTINLLLDEAYGPPYVEYVGKYGVHTYPSSIIVAPDGTYEVLNGFVSKDRFIEFARKILQRGVPPTPPAQPGKP